MGVKALDEFKGRREGYASRLSVNQAEQGDSIMVIKKEVLDIADLADKLSGIIIAQNKKIAIQTQSLKVIGDILHGTHDVTAEILGTDKDTEVPAIKAKEGEEDLPELYSLRRSPLYQRLVCSRQLGEPLLNTRKGFLQDVIKESNECYDHRKTVKDPYDSVI